MNAEDVFDVWAPDDAAWSDWARPALFLGLNDVRVSPAPVDLAPRFPADRLPLDRVTAIVLDLPGHLGLQTALALAELGRRPVPVINTNYGTQAALDLLPHLQELVRGAGLLPQLALRADDPPVFVLDHARLAPGWVPRPNLFDNRWLVYPQDFPSAAHLRSVGFSRVIVARMRGATGGEDLDHVLVRWRDGGLKLEQCTEDGELLPLDPALPSGFRSLMRRISSMAGLSTNSSGGFGSRIPVPSEGGSG